MVILPCAGIYCSTQILRHLKFGFSCYFSPVFKSLQLFRCPWPYLCILVLPWRTNSLALQYCQFMLHSLDSALDNFYFFAFLFIRIFAMPLQSLDNRIFTGFEEFRYLLGCPSGSKRNYVPYAHRVFWLLSFLPTFHTFSPPLLPYFLSYIPIPLYRSYKSIYNIHLQ